MSQVNFSDFNLDPTILGTLQSIGYHTPTPIQERAIPLVLQGEDLLGIAQTGTGKTASFCLPLLSILHTNKKKKAAMSPRALILTPTRELAIQIHENLETYGKSLGLEFAVIFGGVSQGRQVTSLKKGVDVLVATPGRLLDLINQGYLKIQDVEIFVLDEADRMLDMGFVHDIKNRIVPLLPDSRHNLFFSATMPPEIQALAETILNDPKKVEVTPPATTVERIDQSVMYVDRKDKINLLVHLLKGIDDGKVLVFVEMKHVANRVAEKLEANGITASAIHGNKSQNARQKALKDFTNGDLKVLVATDIASRGIDIDGITHVINFELSNIAESYVHRIGRTARAGAEGVSITLVTADEKSYLVNVEKVTNQKIPVVLDQPFHSEEAYGAAVVKVGKAKKKIESERKSKPQGRRPQQDRPRFGEKRSFAKKKEGGRSFSRDNDSSADGYEKKKSFFKSDSESGDRPKRSYSSDRPDRGGFKKKSDGKRSFFKSDSEGGDRPKRSFSDRPDRGDFKKKSEGKRSFFKSDSEGGDRPKRSFSDRPDRGDFKKRSDGKRSFFKSDSEGGDRPKRSFSDRPDRGDFKKKSDGKRSFFKSDSEGGDRPKRSFSSDRPDRGGFKKKSDGKRSFFKSDSEGGDRPKRSFSDRPDRGDFKKKSDGKRSFFKSDSEGGDRPKRSFFGRNSDEGGFKKTGTKRFVRPHSPK